MKKNGFKNSQHNTHMLKSTVAKQGPGKGDKLRVTKQQQLKNNTGEGERGEKKEAIKHMRTYKRTRKKIK